MWGGGQNKKEGGGITWVVHLRLRPPEHQLSTVKDIARNARTAVEEDGDGGGGHRVLLGGDLNCDLNGPRHDKEIKDGEAIQEELSALGLRIVEGEGHTYRRVGHVSTLDYIAATSETAWAIKADRRWSQDASDHAMLVGQGIGQGNGHNRPCTPMTMRTIPQEGIEDLRGRFEWLCKAFHVQE